MQQAVLVAGARTPIGRLLGALSEFSATDLGAAAIREALRRARLTGADVDAVVMGNVVQAGVGPNPARLAAVRAGVPMSVPAMTVNKLCLSGLTAVAHAAQLVALGRHEIVVAGGMESMTSAPHVIPGARRGFKFSCPEASTDHKAHRQRPCTQTGMATAGNSTFRQVGEALGPQFSARY